MHEETIKTVESGSETVAISIGPVARGLDAHDILVPAISNALIVYNGPLQLPRTDVSHTIGDASTYVLPEVTFSAGDYELLEDASLALALADSLNGNADDSTLSCPSSGSPLLSTQDLSSRLPTSASDFVHQANLTVENTRRSTFPTFELPKSVVNALVFKTGFLSYDTSSTQSADKHHGNKPRSMSTSAAREVSPFLRLQRSLSASDLQHSLMSSTADSSTLFGSESLRESSPLTDEEPQVSGSELLRGDDEEPKEPKIYTKSDMEEMIADNIMNHEIDLELLEEKYEAKICDYEAKIREYEAKLDDAGKERKRQSDNHVREKAKFRNERKELKKEMDRLEEKNAELGRNLGIMSDENANLEDEYTLLEGDMDNFQTTLSAAIGSIKRVFDREAKDPSTESNVLLHEMENLRRGAQIVHPYHQVREQELFELLDAKNRSHEMEMYAVTQKYETLSRSEKAQKHAYERQVEWTNVLERDVRTLKEQRDRAQDSVQTSLREWRAAVQQRDDMKVALTKSHRDILVLQGYINNMAGEIEQLKAAGRT